MKSYARKVVSSLIIATMLTLCLLSSLTACSDADRLNRMEESERAVEFFKILDQNMESKKSSTRDISMDMTLEIYGVEVKATATGTTVSGNKGTENYFTISDSLTVMEMGGETMETASLEGFIGGKMFSSNTQEGEAAVKQWSPISAADYEAFEETNRSISVVDDLSLLENCQTKTCVQNEDKTWTATYTDYNRQGLEVFDDMLDGFGTLMRGVYVSDVVLTIHASEALYPTFMEFEFVFELDEDADQDSQLPEITGKVVYRDIGTTEPLEVDLSDYTEVADLRVPQIVRKSITDFLNADKGEFEVDMSNTVTYSGQTQKAEEKYVGSFEFTEDGYTYDITLSNASERYHITYKNGKQTVTGEGKPQSTNSTDAQARDVVKNLMDPAGFNATSVRDIELLTDRSNEHISVYLVTLDGAYISEFEQALGGIKLKGTATLEVTIEDGRMTAQTFTLNMLGGGYTITVSSQCTYISFENAMETETQADL